MKCYFIFLNTVVNKKSLIFIAINNELKADAEKMSRVFEKNIHLLKYILISNFSLLILFS